MTTGNIAAAWTMLSPRFAAFTVRLDWSKPTANLDAVYVVIADTVAASQEIVLLRFALSLTASLSYLPPTFNNAEDRLGKHDVATAPKLSCLIKIPAGALELFFAAFEDITYTVKQWAIECDARHPAVELLPYSHESKTGGLGPRVLGKPCD